MTESLVERLARRRKEEGLDKGTTRLLKTEVDDDLIPDISSDISEEDDRLYQLADSISIVDAYIKWCGKMVPRVGSRTESIMISCPIPGHEDRNPSAWINTEKEVWHCGACEQGGDKFDIAAWNFGYQVPAYKEKFGELLQKMAESLGYTVERTRGGSTLAYKAEEEPETEVQQEPDLDSGEVTELYPERAQEAPIAIDWRALAPEGTFLREWMEEMSNDDLPEEYYVWLGLQALGLAAGRDAALDDNPLVYGNLFICLLGNTGLGKSRSVKALSNLMRDALPYDRSETASTGVLCADQPGSAESLIDLFDHPLYDPNDTSRILGRAPVRGLIRVSELSTLAGLAERRGSLFKPVLMSLYDADDVIEQRTRSSGLVKAEQSFCSMISTTQPRALRTLLSQDDLNSGFLNRWVFASGVPKAQVAYGRQEPRTDHLVELIRQVRAWCGYGRRVRLTGDALALWEEFFRVNIQPLKINDDDEDSGAVLARIDLLMKKLILLLSLNAKTAEPSVAIVEAALSLFPYLTSGYAKAGVAISMSELEEAREEIVKVLAIADAQTGKGLTLRELGRRLPRRIGSEVRKRAIENMLYLDEIEEIPSPTGKRGRPTIRYRLTS